MLARCVFTVMIPTGRRDTVAKQRLFLSPVNRKLTRQAYVGVGKVRLAFMCASKRRRKDAQMNFFTDRITMSQAPSPFFRCLRAWFSLTLTPKCEDLIWSSERKEKTLT